ncbi:DUF2167 domain-containing protein [Lysobacter fragariae]
MKFKWMLASLLVVAMGARAQDQGEGEEAARQMVAALAWKDGTVTVDGAHATLKLDPNFRYLGAADARKVLENLWGNPPDDSVLGMVVPKGAGVMADNGWAVVVTYSDDGHISDEDAAKMDYADLMKDMQAEDKEVNEARKEAGYPGLHVMGWAEPPHYDAANKKLYWAKELKSDDSDTNTLNYDIRVLGRHGYMSMNAVARMSEMGEVKTGMQRLLPMVEFDAGSRYADFNGSTDKLAAYGIAALIGGGIAAKSGLLAKLGLLLLGLKKLLIPLFVVVAASFKKVVGFFRRDKDKGVVS